MSRITVSGRWGPRRTTPEEAAQQLLRVLDALRDVHPAFGRLYRSRSRGRDPLVAIGGDVSTLAAEIARGILRNDTDRMPMEGAGYSLHWDDNTRRFEQAKLVLTCGATSRGNILHADLPPEAQADGTSPSAIRHALLTIVDAFQTEWGSAADADAWVRPADPSTPPAGWMAYLRTTRPPLRLAGIEAEAIAGGVLYTTTPEWFDHANPAHARRAARLAEALRSGRSTVS